MKYNTVMTHWQTATHYKFNLIQDPVTLNGARQFYPSGDIKITMIARTDRNIIVYSDEPLGIFERLGEIRDRSGAVVVPGDYKITLVVPTVNALGYSDGYAYRVSPIPDATLQEDLGNNA